MLARRFSAVRLLAARLHWCMSASSLRSRYAVCAGPIMTDCHCCTPARAFTEVLYSSASSSLSRACVCSRRFVRRGASTSPRACYCITLARVAA